jgi:hypothetical protein
MAGMGPPPKPASKRRHSTPPKSWGGANPIEAPAAKVAPRELGIDNPHRLVEQMWEALQTSCESRFYSQADWVRVRFELWHANSVLTNGKPILANSWQQIQLGLNTLLVSPAEKRRCAIDVKPSVSDADQDAAISMMSKYRAKLV